MTKKPIIIGITGGSASGKTLFLNSLFEKFKPEDICLISQDNYYKTIDLVPKDENGIANFDVPESIDFKLFAQHINDLKNGKIVKMPEYSFEQEIENPRILEFLPAPIIIVEGIFVLYYAYISKILNLKVFIDAKEHVKIGRRINRDLSERGYDLNTILYRWENHVCPTFEKYISPTKQFADIIINNNKTFDKGLNILTAYLNQFLKDS